MECVNISNEQKTSANDRYNALNLSIPISLIARCSRKLYFIYKYKNEKINKIIYEPLRTYSFYDDGDYGKVLIKLAGVEKLQKNDLKVNFDKRSLEIKINNLNDKAYVFAVPKTHLKLETDQCSYFLKKDKIVLKLKKFNSKEEFTALHKQKMIGEIPSDEDK